MKTKDLIFRAWDVTQEPPKMEIFSIGEGFSGLGYCPIMQCSRIKDKNKIDIFDGDILKDEKGNVFRVYNVDGGFVVKSSIWLRDMNEFADMDYLVSEPLSCPQMQSFISYSCEVIGNIYENKELLVNKTLKL